MKTDNTHNHSAYTSNRAQQKIYARNFPKDKKGIVDKLTSLVNDKASNIKAQNTRSLNHFEISWNEGSSKHFINMKIENIIYPGNWTRMTIFREGTEIGNIYTFQENKTEDNYRQLKQALDLITKDTNNQNHHHHNSSSRANRSHTHWTYKKQANQNQSNSYSWWETNKNKQSYHQSKYYYHRNQYENRRSQKQNEESKRRQEQKNYHSYQANWSKNRENMSVKRGSNTAEKLFHEALKEGTLVLFNLEPVLDDFERSVKKKIGLSDKQLRNQEGIPYFKMKLFINELKEFLHLDRNATPTDLKRVVTKLMRMKNITDQPSVMKFLDYLGEDAKASRLNSLRKIFDYRLILRNFLSSKEYMDR